jgi:hypothetical protein
VGEQDVLLLNLTWFSGSGLAAGLILPYPISAFCFRAIMDLTMGSAATTRLDARTGDILSWG